MSSETDSVLSKVKEIAALAGMRAAIDEMKECVVTGFQFPDGRSQAIYIRHSGSVGGNNVVTFFSP